MVKDTVSFSDFQKLDLRVGKVVLAEKVEGLENLIRMEVDLGKEYGRQKILAGIAKWYKPEDLKGKKYIFVANLEPKQMMGQLSKGMILCADIGGKAVLIPVNGEIPVGAVVR